MNGVCMHHEWCYVYLYIIELKHFHHNDADVNDDGKGQHNRLCFYHHIFPSK